MSQGYPPGPFGQPGGFPQPGYGRPPHPQQGFGQGYGAPTPWQQPWPQQPSWQGFPGGYPQFPPPKRRGDLSSVLVAALGIVSLVIVGFVLYSLFGQPDYANDDYVPPPPGNVQPLPDFTGGDVNAVLTANPLYAQTLPTPVRCELRHRDMDVRTASDEVVKEYIDDLMACNMRVWNPPVEGTQQFTLVRPEVNIYQRDITTPCGTQNGPNALYCPANQQVYYSRELWRLPGLQIQGDPHVIDEVMAHEFGHALQARTLLLQSSTYKQRQDDRSGALELRRRTEVQADCFAGMYLQSVYRSTGYTQADIDRIMESVRLGGDDELRGRPGDAGVMGDHGHGASRLYWHQVGLTTTDIGRCNTFTAPEEHVR